MVKIVKVKYVINKNQMVKYVLVKIAMLKYVANC